MENRENGQSRREKTREKEKDREKRKKERKRERERERERERTREREEKVSGRGNFLDKIQIEKRTYGLTNIFRHSFTIVSLYNFFFILTF